jgi:AcrR family transcriptional regulator
VNATPNPERPAAPGRGPGRPPDSAISARTLAATRELLVQQGFEATTVSAVACRAGVHASAIYRRWPSRYELIEEATFPGLDSVAVAPTGDLTRDLRRFIRIYSAVLDAPAARAAAAGMTAYHQSAGRARPPEAYLRISARPQFRAVLAAAPSNAVDPAVDPDDVFDMILAVLLTRTVLAAATARRRPLERLVEMAIRVLSPGALSADRK